MLRANVRFTIANRNYTEAMRNKSSIDFHETARPLCQEVRIKFTCLRFLYGQEQVSSLKFKSPMSKNAL